MAADLTLLRDLILDLAERREWEEVRSMMIGLHPADLAEIISAAPEELRPALFDIVDEELKPDVMAELESHVGADIIEALPSHEASDIVEEMEPDDAADLLGDLSEERSEKILKAMEAPESSEVRDLLKYDEDTAGGIMTPHLVALNGNLTVSEAIERIAYLDEDEPFYNAYVVDDDHGLVGVLGLWELLKERNRSRTLADIAHRDALAVHTDTDQEEVAKTMAKYDLTAMPVVDRGGRLVGRITVDDVMDVMEEEASEDIFRLAGSDHSELSLTTPFQACRVRLPWLLITLATGFVTSFIFKEFIDNLEAVLVLSFFVPIVMAMGGNTGIQSSTLIIRSIALGTLQGTGLARILLREVLTAMIMGVICGSVIAVWAGFLVVHTPAEQELFSPAFLGSIVGLSLFCAMMFAALFGAFVPITLNRLQIDPAVASGPFVTASNDIFALLIYYGVTFGIVSFSLRAQGLPL